MYSYSCMYRGVRGLAARVYRTGVHGPMELASRAAVGRSSTGVWIACGAVASAVPRTVHGEGPEWYRSRTPETLVCMYLGQTSDDLRLMICRSTRVTE